MQTDRWQMQSRRMYPVCCSVFPPSPRINVKGMGKGQFLFFNFFPMLFQGEKHFWPRNLEMRLQRSSGSRLVQGHVTEKVSPNLVVGLGKISFVDLGSIACQYFISKWRANHKEVHRRDCSPSMYQAHPRVGSLAFGFQRSTEFGLRKLSNLCAVFVRAMLLFALYVCGKGPKIDAQHQKWSLAFVVCNDLRCGIRSRKSFRYSFSSTKNSQRMQLVQHSRVFPVFPLQRAPSTSGPVISAEILGPLSAQVSFQACAAPSGLLPRTGMRHLIAELRRSVGPWPQRFNWVKLMIALLFWTPMWRCVEKFRSQTRSLWREWKVLFFWSVLPERTNCKTISMIPFWISTTTARSSSKILHFPTVNFDWETLQ